MPIGARHIGGVVLEGWAAMSGQDHTGWRLSFLAHRGVEEVLEALRFHVGNARFAKIQIRPYSG
jgi:hypothetical protein